MRQLRRGGDRNNPDRLALREGSLAARFAPGERLAEIPLAAALGASRTPVRLALERLEAEGLVAPPAEAFRCAASPCPRSRTPSRCAARWRAWPRATRTTSTTCGQGARAEALMREHADNARRNLRAVLAAGAAAPLRLIAAA